MRASHTVDPTTGLPLQGQKIIHPPTTETQWSTALLLHLCVTHSDILDLIKTKNNKRSVSCLVWRFTALFWLLFLKPNMTDITSSKTYLTYSTFYFLYPVHHPTDLTLTNVANLFSLQPLIWKETLTTPVSLFWKGLTTLWVWLLLSNQIWWFLPQITLVQIWFNPHERIWLLLLF